MNPNTRGAANSLYRSTGRSSQRKALQEQEIPLKIFDSTMKEEGFPCRMYDRKGRETPFFID